ncbi:MAG TPA: aspartate carbamoyltransferase catalytic subunit [Saccharofermentans sp.]|jgi:aspartate carbamoyltransferase catalytic subunit|nr:aspartate carbamoyltransferase catalytic subunit [Clostridia bacterium]HOO48342.1 aspartate carbamoyltransferase catalytic subunit [Saccharofermentans sp.]HPG64980.1 aspartate carbamoyltransferase catalytic subunit [Saccharofermentans sp.]HPJ81624.1 aspartate carbamoyltransferase catalytic subunit [Saccharofermentans sp.]HPQ31955.1 aspartate carbamoyltransferase catalytic subunit [Saccharofermentans sp.]
MGLKNKDLLGMKQLSAEEIMEILETAKTMKMVLTSGNKKTSHLQGKSVVTLFYENSTRTRLSFELASKYMGSASANISASGSSVSKGESLLDTVRTIDMMATDIVVMRHPQSGAPHFIAPYLNASVVNAGDGMNEHPTQALLDLFTMYERFDSFEGKNIAICGDLYHSRVVRSNTIGLTKLGAKVSVYGPRTMVPVGIEKMGARVASSVADAVKDADAVMGLRVQLERQHKSLFPSVAEYSSFYSITSDILALAKPEAFLMHPGPCNHGVELPTAVYDCDQSVINEQVTNGVAVRMAVLYMLMARRNSL